VIFTLYAYPETDKSHFRDQKKLKKIIPKMAFADLRMFFRRQKGIRKSTFVYLGMRGEKASFTLVS
jgi:hypothetical protein